MGSHELNGKTSLRAQVTEARAQAKSKLETADAKEKAEKYLKKSRLQSMSANGVAVTTIKSDVSAFVDSGPGMKGTNVAALKDAMDHTQGRVKTLSKILVEQKKIYQTAERK